jgi:hypothetical protein
MADVTVVQSQAPMSSVQIEGRAKGPPAITVKVYAENVAEAAEAARLKYDELVERYAQEG